MLTAIIVIGQSAREGRKSSIVGRELETRDWSRTNFLWHCKERIDGGTALPHSALSRVVGSARRGGARGERVGEGRGRQDGGTAPVCVPCTCTRTLPQHIITSRSD